MVVVVARAKPTHPLQTADPPSHGGDLPPHVLAEAQRIADSAAGRLLAEKLDRDAVCTPTPTNGRPLNGRADERPLLANGEIVPSLGNGQPVRHPEAA